MMANRSDFGEVAEEVRQALQDAIGRVGDKWKVRREREAQKLRDSKQRADEKDAEMSNISTDAAGRHDTDKKSGTDADGQGSPNDVDVDQPSSTDIGPVRGDGTPDNPYVYELRPRKDWTPEQHDEFIDKIARINASEPELIDPDLVSDRSSGFRRKYMQSIVNEIIGDFGLDRRGDADLIRDIRAELKNQLKGKDIDHAVELQLGGLDELLNAIPLNSSVNRSVGSQIKNVLDDLENIGDHVRFDIDWLNPRD